MNLSKTESVPLQDRVYFYLLSHMSSHNLKGPTYHRAQAVRTAAREQSYGNFLLRSIIEFLKDPLYRSLLITSTVILIIGTVAYHELEGWSWLDSLYFSVITLTTIGFGDFAPQTSGGKIFTMLYIVVGLGMILGFINAVYEHYRFHNEARMDRKSNPD